MSSRSLPPILTALHQLDFEYADGAGYDFEPYQEFLSASETDEWLRAWTGNDEISGDAFRVFGQDGSGGYAALWTPATPPSVDQHAGDEHPVVFLGSEGSVGVVAQDLNDYLWLLAGGIGPAEAVEEPNRAPAPADLSAPFRAFADQHARGDRQSSAQVLAAAQQRHPDFAEHIERMCR